METKRYLNRVSRHTHHASGIDEEQCWWKLGRCDERAGRTQVYNVSPHHLANINKVISHRTAFRFQLIQMFDRLTRFTEKPLHGLAAVHCREQEWAKHNDCTTVEQRCAANGNFTFVWSARFCFCICHSPTHVDASTYSIWLTLYDQEKAQILQCMTNSILVVAIYDTLFEFNRACAVCENAEAHSIQCACACAP